MSMFMLRLSPNQKRILLFCSLGLIGFVVLYPFSKSSQSIENSIENTSIAPSESSTPSNTTSTTTTTTTTTEPPPTIDDDELAKIVNTILYNKSWSTFRFRHERPWLKYRMEDGQNRSCVGNLVAVNAEASLLGLERRNVLREMFKKFSITATYKFFLGVSSFLSTEKLQQEIREHDDIIFIDIPDHNRTLKFNAIMHWQQNYCENAFRLVIQRDDSAVLLNKVMYYMFTSIDWDDYVLCERGQGRTEDGVFLGVCKDNIMVFMPKAVKNRFFELVMNYDYEDPLRDNGRKVDDWNVKHFNGFNSTEDHLCTKPYRVNGGDLTTMPIQLKNLRTADDMERGFKLLLEAKC